MTTITISNDSVRNAIVGALNAVMDNAVRVAVDASRPDRDATAAALNEIFPGSTQPAETVIAAAKADFIAAREALWVALGYEGDADAVAVFDIHVSVELNSGDASLNSSFA